MLPSQEKNSKKKFQKPNILRKRSKKPVKPNAMEVYESPDTNSLVNINCVALDENGIKVESFEAQNTVGQFDLEISPDIELGDTYDDQEGEGVLETSASRGSSKLVFENDEILIEANSQTEADDMKSMFINIFNLILMLSISSLVFHNPYCNILFWVINNYFGLYCIC